MGGDALRQPVSDGLQFDHTFEGAKGFFHHVLVKVEPYQFHFGPGASRENTGVAVKLFRLM